MTASDALKIAHERSVQVYQRKVHLAQTAQQVQVESAECDAEFLRLDGEIRVLTALVAAAPAEVPDGQ